MEKSVYTIKIKQFADYKIVKHMLKTTMLDYVTRWVPYRKYEPRVGGRLEISNEACKPEVHIFDME